MPEQAPAVFQWVDPGNMGEFIDAAFDRRDVARRTDAAPVPGQHAIRRLVAREVGIFVRNGIRRFRAAHLVERGSITQYRDQLGEARKLRPELHFLVSGPWPPYSFSNIDLEFKTLFGVN